MFLVPIVGMLCGNCVAGIVVAVSYILKEFQYVHIGSSSFSFIFMQLNFLGRIEIKLKFIWLSEQLG
jgi:hypothetical protein